MEEEFENDSIHGRQNIEMMKKLPTLVMNQVRLSYKIASTEFRDDAARNAHFGKHLKGTINTFMHYHFTEDECRRREQVHYDKGVIVPGVCRSITDPSTGVCRFGDECKYLHVEPRGQTNTLRP
jgi:hypothetical protein